MESVIIKNRTFITSIFHKLIVLVIGILVSHNVLFAQDPTFTQFYSNPLYLNPALAGSTGCPRINMNYRNEWPQLTGNYVTYSASFDTYSKDINGGVGLMARIIFCFTAVVHISGFPMERWSLIRKEMCTRISPIILSM